MPDPRVIMWVVVLVVGIPSAWWNPTAGALVLCWVFSKVLYMATGNGLATQYFIFPDLFVLAVIYLKSRRRLPNGRIGEILHEAFCTDRVVLLIFPVMWVFYAAPVGPYYQYWALYVLAITQFLAAGWEALHPHPCDYAEVGDREDTRLMCQAANDTP